MLSTLSLIGFDGCVVGERGDGVVVPLEEIPFGLCSIVVLLCPLLGLSSSLEMSLELFRDRQPARLFFCLNFSSQLELSNF